MGYGRDDLGHPIHRWFVFYCCDYFKFSVSKALAGEAIGNEVVTYLMALVILLVGFIGFSAVITNENIQDFKSGQMVGATPYKQQISLFIGVDLRNDLSAIYD